MTAQRRHAEIAGAGIGGLSAAAALAMRGWTVTVHERSSTLRSFGAGIYIWSNGLRVLKALGAYDETTVGAHVGPVMEMRDERNRVVETIPINGPSDARLITILRETLLNALVANCKRHGVEIRTDSEAVAARADGTLILADGSQRRADLVVGADGINSKVRDALDLLMYRKNLGYGAIRMMIDRRPDDLNPDDRDKYIEHFTGSRRILYTPASADDLYIALCCGAEDANATAVPADRALWTESFPHLASVIARFGEVGRWDAFEVVKLKRWSTGHVAILGDAAHAMPPYLGQGGGCALMNAIGLAAAVEEGRGIESGLAGWEERERPLTEHTQEMSERQGDMNYWPDDIRAEVMAITGRSREITTTRLRTALHVPTATETAI